MLDGIALVAVVLALTLALPVACIVFPSLLPHARFNEQGHRFFIDVQMFKMGAIIGCVGMIASAFKQGDTQPGVLLMAVGLGLVVGAFMGLWAHLMWRRQQSLRKRLDSLPSH